MFVYVTLNPGVDLQCKAFDLRTEVVKVNGRNQEVRKMTPVACDILMRTGDEVGAYIAPLPEGHSILFSLRACWQNNGTCSDWTGGP